MHGALAVIKRIGVEALDDNITDIGAMMAYYVVLALFPMIVFLLTIGLLVVDPSTIEEGLAMAYRAMPASVAELLAIQVRSLMATAETGFAVGAAALALWGASRGAASLSGALNTVFDKRETRSWLTRQLTAIAVTAGLAVLMLVALGLLVVGPTVGHFLADRFGLGDAFDVAWGIARWLGAGLLVMVVWAVLYKFLPDTDAPLRIFTPGAAVGVVLWLAISALFGLYLGHFNSYDATYGALGGAIIFLTWLWLSNIALLIGAEINDVLADIRRDRSDAARQLARAESAPACESSDAARHEA